MALEIAAGPDEISSVLEEALAASQADETEALFMRSEAALTRFTRNEIHENVVEADRTLNVRAIVGKRVGVASTNRLDRQSIAAAVARACAIARLAPEDADFPGLPGPAGEAPDLPGMYDPASGQAGPDVRAEAVGAIAKVMRHHQLHGAGYFATREDVVAIANTKGVRRFARTSDVAVNIKAIGDDSSGYAEGYARALASIDATALAEKAAKLALDGRDPAPLAPGTYTVVLEPPAFREFIGYLAWTGLGAQSLDEGSSFMTGRLGEKLMGDGVTLRDDYTHPLGAGLPFDFEGVPRRQVALVERGIARDVVYDSYYAAKMGHANTGHALPAPNAAGPLPLNLVADPGTKSQAELIAEIEHGVLMARTWYIRLVDQKKTIVTGMSRDGLFLIEHGRVTRGLKNMRFNESIVDALGRCELARDLVRSENAVLPAVRIDGFHFTSGTTF